MTVQERWTKRELQRSLNAALLERAFLDPPKASAALRAIHREVEQLFRVDPLTPRRRSSIAPPDARCREALK